MKRIALILGTLMAIMGVATSSHARIYIPIDQPSDQKFPIAIVDLKTEGGSSSAAENIAEIIRNDLTLSGYFLLIPPAGFKKAAEKDGSEDSQINFAFWKSINAQALVKGTVAKESGKDAITIKLYDPFIGQMIMGKKYLAKKDNWREVAHRFSDEIMEALTGIKGVFNTRIAYSIATKKGKELAVMDMDGFNTKELTKNKSINLSPAWSPDNKELVFTSYVRGNPDLFLMNVGGKRIRQITKGDGGKITPSWSPKGDRIAMASSESGISNLYMISTEGKTLQRLTDGKVIDLAPVWNSEGTQLAFSSERSGGLHIYRMNADGSNIQRLTFVGSWNDMPNWAPLGDKIAFSGRTGGNFDVFIMNADGSNIQRLTVGAGSNEHPSFSPDGRFITFSSTRTGNPAVYIMRRDGSNQTKISKGNGVLPAWSPRP